MKTRRRSDSGRPWGTFAGFILSAGCLSFAIAASQAPTSPAPASPAQVTFFETNIRPILANSCYPCHGPSTQMAGLRLDSQDSILKGGGSGPAIEPGYPDKSLLIQAVRQTGRLKMPQGGVLKPAEVDALVAWVKMGAPWPSTSAKPMAPTLWSLQPVKMPPLPTVHNAKWVREPLDAYVLADLESKKLKPAPPADKRTLLRRVTYDLTGLPPTPEEMDAFLADKSQDAYEKVVDRLLASPHYGERWARHWMDVARYADTKGYVFDQDRNYYNAYTYRDWLIEAFNKDLPYDQFIVQQLAADRLPQVQSGEDPKPLAALGFLTLGRRFLGSEPDIIDDRIDVTMRGFEAFTVACARCHDHKFDPIPTQDYYSLYSVFASSAEKEIPISDKSIDQPWEQYTAKLSDLNNKFQALTLDQTKLMRKKLQDPEQAKAITAEQKQVLQSLAESAPPTGDNLKKLMPAFDPVAVAQINQMTKERADMEAHAPTKPELAMAMVDNNPHDGYVFMRGKPENHGPEAPRRFLLALSTSSDRPHWTKDSGRLELAEAIASKDNPLTARVFVNRLWQDHFGAGIVATTSDFGHQGEKPSNPALLDYLATTFMQNGWSIKKMQKMIVMSATYQESSAVTEQDMSIDPENRDFERMNRRRLDLEQIRDTLMDVSGRLDLKDVGGKSVDLWSEPFTPRRAVYGYIERQNLPGIFRTFDFATPDTTSSKRFMTTVPQQALFFMNSPFVVESAEALDQRPQVKDAKDDKQRIQEIYRLLFQRSPRSEELSIGLQYLKSQADATVPSPANIWSYGYGECDPTKGRVISFTPMTVFSNGGYHISKDFPDPKLGYMLLNSVGGHPGHDLSHAVIRRWTAPTNMKISISGVLGHGQDKGDGVRGRIVSSRSGILGEWQVFNSTAKTEIASVSVQKGDTIDFVVDPKTNDSYDSFSWAPTIQNLGGGDSWPASEVSPPGAPVLTRLALYTQALMMTNEFMFID